MMQRRWESPEVDDDRTLPGHPGPTLVSLHFLYSALRRRWLACAMSAVLGLLTAGAYLATFPQPHRAEAALILTHEEGVDASEAMSTNVGLLMTRTVAAKTVVSLQLDMTPEDLLRTIETEELGPDLLLLTLSAPSEDEAVRRLAALTSIYLDFRAEQLTLQSKVLLDGMEERIEKLREDVEAQTRRIEDLSASRRPNPGELSDTIADRAYLQSRIEALEQSAEDVSLKNAAVVSSSRVIDPAATVPGGAKRRMALVLASGLIGGTALGCGSVLFLAITSDRLRRRSDVALALGLPVPVSVGRIAAIPRGWRWLPLLGALNHRRTDARQRLARAIEDELLKNPSAPLVVAGLDNTNELGTVLAEVAGSLAAHDYVTTIIDLTEGGSRGLKNAAWAPGLLNPPTVLRPRGLPPLARGADDLLVIGQWDDDYSAPEPQLGDATLVLADLDPTVGADHLLAWADRAIIVVTAGRASAERVRTVGEVARAAGLDLRFAALMHTEATDDSSGEAGLDRRESVQLPAERDQPRTTARSEAR